MSAESAAKQQEAITARKELDLEFEKASAERKEQLTEIEVYSTSIDEETGEEMLNPEMYFALKDGLDKFDEVPHPQEAAAYLASAPTAAQRVWPRETSYDWDDIAELAGTGQSFANPAEADRAMIRIRDQLSSIGADVPEGRPPRGGSMYEAPSGPEGDRTEMPEPTAPTAPSGPMPGATQPAPQSHIQRRIRERRKRRGGR